MGRLLLHAGKVDARTMHRYEKESQQAGKASFKFGESGHGAWRWHDADAPATCAVAAVSCQLAHLLAALIALSPGCSMGHGSERGGAITRRDGGGRNGLPLEWPA